jgi:hypothetical protein
MSNRQPFITADFMLYVEMVCISLPVSRSCVRMSLSQTVCITTLGLSDKGMTMQDMVSVHNALNYVRMSSGGRRPLMSLKAEHIGLMYSGHTVCRLPKTQNI